MIRDLIVILFVALTRLPYFYFSFDFQYEESCFINWLLLDVKLVYCLKLPVKKVHLRPKSAINADTVYLYLHDTSFLQLIQLH